jgi:hypothetical protein
LCDYEAKRNTQIQLRSMGRVELLVIFWEAGD